MNRGTEKRAARVLTEVRKFVWHRLKPAAPWLMAFANAADAADAADAAERGEMPAGCKLYLGIDLERV